MEVKCSHCGKEVTLTPQAYKCFCGGAWELFEKNEFDPNLIDKNCYSIFRYKKFLGLDFNEPVVDLGAGWTPIVKKNVFGSEVLLKVDFLTPSGSYKDRGTCVIINILAHQGVKMIVDDSSGNAGAAMSAYANAAGMSVDIFVPADCSPAKKAQIAVYGSTIHLVEGERICATEAAVAMVDDEHVYASHAYHPGFILGQQTVAWELWEQLSGRLPDAIIIPVAQGGNFLGIWYGFRRLLHAGIIQKIPKLIAVQSANVCPIVNAFGSGEKTVKAVKPAYTIAEGVAVTNPVRGERILQALYETGGFAVAVNDHDVFEAQKELAKKGIWIEVTSATAIAALVEARGKLRNDETIMISLTSSGLKTMVIQ